MKNNLKKSIPVLVFMLASFMLISMIPDKTSKDKWTKAEKEAFLKSCKKELKAVEEINADAYCKCMFKKVKNKYSKPSEAANMDESWLKEEALKCIEAAINQ